MSAKARDGAKGRLSEVGPEEEEAEPSFFRINGRNEMKEEMREGGKNDLHTVSTQTLSPPHTLKLVGGAWRWAPANRYVTYRLCAFDFICHFLHCKYHRNVSFLHIVFVITAVPASFLLLAPPTFSPPPLLLYLFPPRHLKVFDDRCEVLDVMTMTYGCTKMIFLYE